MYSASLFDISQTVVKYNILQEFIPILCTSSFAQTKNLDSILESIFLIHMVVVVLLGSCNRKKEDKMLVAKRQRMEKPMKIEQRKVQTEWGPQYPG